MPEGWGKIKLFWTLYRPWIEHLKRWWSLRTTSSKNHHSENKHCHPLAIQHKFSWQRWPPEGQKAGDHIWFTGINQNKVSPLYKYEAKMGQIHSRAGTSVDREVSSSLPSPISPHFYSIKSLAKVLPVKTEQERIITHIAAHHQRAWDTLG